MAWPEEGIEGEAAALESMLPRSASCRASPGGMGASAAASLLMSSSSLATRTCRGAARRMHVAALGAERLSASTAPSWYEPRARSGQGARGLG